MPGRDCEPVARSALCNVVVVKVLMLEAAMLVCDAFWSFDTSFPREDSRVQMIWEFVVAHGVRQGNCGCVYLDADMSEEGQLVLFLDRAVKCDW
jgi:hypothetical protein